MLSLGRVALCAGCLVGLGLGATARAVQADAMAGSGNAIIIEKNGELTGSFTYQLVVGQFFEWNTDPTAVPGILGELARRSAVKAGVEFKAVGLSDPQILRNPLLIMTGNRVFRLSQEEIANLRNYLDRGGFIYADDCGGSDWSFRRMIKDILPESKLEPIPRDHPVFCEGYRLEGVPKVVDLYGGPAEAFGVVRAGRLVVLYTHDTDLPCAWERYPDGSYVHVIDEAKREEALKFGVNIVLHALRQGQGREQPAVRQPFEIPGLKATPLPAAAIASYPLRRQLPSSQITAIAADRESVWVGGFSFLPGDDEGLARYDKSTERWRVFMDAEGILSEEINGLALSEGKVLVGSDTWKWTKGMATFNPANGRWSTFTTEQGLPHDRVVAILPDEDRLWIACRQGLAVIDRNPKGSVGTPPDDRSVPSTPSARFLARLELNAPNLPSRSSDESPGADIPAPAGDLGRATVIQDSAFPGDGPLMIGLMSGGRFVWANHAAGVACFDKRSRRWSDLSKSTPLLPRHAMAMACAGRAAWFLSPVDEHVKLVRYDLEDDVYSDWAVPSELDLDKAVSLAADGREVLVGMRENLGIYTLATADGSLVRHWVPPSVPHDRSLAVGRMVYDEGVVWAALWPYGGLWRRAADATDWREIPYRTGSPASHILSLLRRGDALYVGTAGVGPWRYDLKSQSWSSLNLSLLRDGQPFTYLGDYSAIRWDNIYGMADDGRRIWMVTNHGLIVHDPERTPSGFEVIGPVGTVAKGLAVARGLIWMGTDEGRVRVYDPEARTWKVDSTWAPGVPVRALCVWRKSLWAATAKGLYVRPIENGEWAKAAEIPEPLDFQGLWPTETGLWVASKESLRVLRTAGQPAREIAASRAWVPVHGVYPYQGKIHVATDCGLIVCQDDGTPCAFYDRTSGLEAPAIGAIEGDERYLWLGTLGGGLVRLDSVALAAGQESVGASAGATNGLAPSAVPKAR